jgi:hypothetical protein
MKAPSLTIQKIWPLLKFLLTDGQAKNYMPPIFRYGDIKKGEKGINKYICIQIL